MERLLSGQQIDKIILCSFIIALMLNITIDVVTFSMNINLENSDIKSKKKYPVLWIIICTLLVVLCTFLILQSQLRLTKYYNIIVSILVMLFIGYCIYKSLNAVSKVKLKKARIDSDVKYCILFSQMIYAILFQSSIYNQIIGVFSSIDSSFVTDILIIGYMCIKSSVVLMFIMTNLLFIYENIFELFLWRIDALLLRLKDFFENIQLDNSYFYIDILDEDKSILVRMIITIFQYLKILVLTFIFYFIEYIKNIIVLIIKIISAPFLIFKSFLNKGKIIIYKIIRISIILSISFMYIHILNHNLFNDNSVKLFEFIGITLIITIAMQQFSEVDKIEKYKDR